MVGILWVVVHDRRVGLKSREMLMKVETYKTAGNTVELQT